ncbi:MAG TPA: UbiD family decarboxylase [Xanthobacteraceae bacterium]|jgi:UbiD family decarboxylase|nr:UbiD family decarboxylase [Xanthobacteraceae bacterium]
MKADTKDTALRPSSTLSEHLARLEEKGLLVRVDDPINKDTELHPLVRCQYVGGVPETERRAFLFTNVVDSAGRRYDMPVVVGALAASPDVYAVGMARPIDQINAAWADAFAHPIKPERVNGPACQEIIIKGDALKEKGGGLALLPVPVSTPGFDAAPTLTATLVITKNPDNGAQNMSTNRAALKSADRLGVRMSARIGGSGGYLNWLKYKERGEPMPCAIVVGCAPVVAYTGPQKLPVDQDEVTVAGALAGQPIRVARAQTVDLDVPADAEIIIEGFVDPDMLEPEGPFGESTGYVALEDYNMCMQVTAITHRKDAVFTSIISQVTPSESSVMRRVAFEALFLTHLREHLGIKGILRVVMHEPLSNVRPVIFLRFKNGTPQTEIWRGLQGASSRLADCGKIVVAVSEDIDPDNSDAVFWSLAYRSNPVEDVLVVPHRSPGHGPSSDHSGPTSTGKKQSSSLLIDATLKHVMPPIALPAREFMEQAFVLWDKLGLRPLTPRAPWHGYQLGDWTDAWETFARNATAGEWQKNGDNTFGRQRGGLTPETSVRDIETKKT